MTCTMNVQFIAWKFQIRTEQNNRIRTIQIVASTITNAQTFYAIFGSSLIHFLLRKTFVLFLSQGSWAAALMRRDAS